MRKALRDLKMKKECRNCDWYILPKESVTLSYLRENLKEVKNDNYIGICRDAVERAREVVPFAVHLNAVKIYPWGGKNCPCFKIKEK